MLDLLIADRNCAVNIKQQSRNYSGDVNLNEPF